MVIYGVGLNVSEGSELFCKTVAGSAGFIENITDHNVRLHYRKSYIMPQWYSNRMTELREGFIAVFY